MVGNLPELSPGEHLRLQGQWDNHPKHGLQFKAEVCEQTLPSTLAGIEGYLGSGMIKGIGPRFAERTESFQGRDLQLTFAIFALTQQNIISLSVATSLNFLGNYMISSSYD